MSLSVAQGTATGTASMVFHCRAEVCELQIHNHSGADVFIGSSGITSNTGYKIEHKSELAITIYNEDRLYAVTAGGTQTIDILHTQPNP
jgi:hypothetical protein